MPAPRDYDWTHTRVVGDRAAAAPYLSFARKLLGFVKQDAGRQGIRTHQVTKRLPDGAVVVAEIHGAIPRITIVPPGAGEGVPLQGLDRFVCWPRSQELPTGIDDQYPELWFDVPGVTRQDGWLTRFNDTDSQAFLDFEGPKGTYRAFEGRPAFLYGTQHGGNLDHRNDQGFRVSWYGPTSRVFSDAYAPPGLVYARFVFMHGQILLDTLQYDIDSEVATPVSDGYVCVYGAALRGMSLYVMQGPQYNLSSSTNPPPDVPQGELYSAELSTGTETRYRLFRYSLAKIPADGQPGVGFQRYKVVPRSRELLWTSTEDLSVAPWTFSPDASVAVMTSADSTQPYAYGTILTRDITVDPPTFAWTNAASEPPAPHALLVTVDVASGASYIEQTSIQAGAGSAVIARDFDRDNLMLSLRVERGTVGDDEGVFSLEFQNVRWPLYSRIGERTAKHRALLFADLRDGVFVFCARTYVYSEPTNPGGGGAAATNGETTLEFWRGDVLMANEPLATGAPSIGKFPYPDACFEDYGYTFFGALNTVPVSPLFAVYGLSLSTVRYTPEGGGSPATVNIYFAHGANSQYAYSAWPSNYTFAWVQPLGGAPVKLPSDRTTLTTLDVTRENYYVPAWCATLGDYTLFSGPSYIAADEYESFNWSNGPSFEELSGVSGARAQYRPLWRIGRFDLPIQLGETQ